MAGRAPHGVSLQIEKWPDVFGTCGPRAWVHVGLNGMAHDLHPARHMPSVAYHPRGAKTGIFARALGRCCESRTLV